MSETTTTPAPAAAQPPSPEAVWNRLEADVDVFLAALPGPARIPVARLVWEAAVLGFANGHRHARLAPDKRPADGAHPARVVAGVMGLAGRLADDADFAALHALAHASERARAVPAAAAETKRGDCDG